jgi:hypothetical protein
LYWCLVHQWRPPRVPRPPGRLGTVDKLLVPPGRRDHPAGRRPGPAPVASPSSAASTSDARCPGAQARGAAGGRDRKNPPQTSPRGLPGALFEAFQGRFRVATARTCRSGSSTGRPRPSTRPPWKSSSGRASPADDPGAGAGIARPRPRGRPGGRSDGAGDAAQAAASGGAGRADDEGWPTTGQRGPGRSCLSVHRGTPGRIRDFPGRIRDFPGRIRDFPGRI